MSDVDPIASGRTVHPTTPPAQRDWIRIPPGSGEDNHPKPCEGESDGEAIHPILIEYDNLCGWTSKTIKRLISSGSLPRCNE